jgi:hypothetical protein
MRDDTLRSVLLVKAIEESDRAGEIIPLADRAAASREALREKSVDEAAEVGADESILPRKAQRLLAARARRLRDALVARYPFLDTVLRVASGPTWLAWATIAASLALGGAMSALDGSRRIDILAFPLLGLILWNLLVYGFIAVRAVRGGSPHPRWSPAALYGRSALSAAKHLLAQSSFFNAPLTEALKRFVSDWAGAAQRLLLARGTRLFHVCAAAVAVGLVAGLYVRGTTLQYMAGWESTFLGPATVASLLGLIYGPASFLSGIALPDSMRLEAIRWAGGQGGENAAPWIHLIAVTAALYIVVPRLLLALLSSLRVWRLALAAPVPAGIVPYYRTVFGAEGLPPGHGIVSVIAYSYELAHESVGVLKKLLPAAIGEGTAVDLRSAVRYGDEEEFLARLADHGGGISDCIVLLMSLASTPEDENHGTVVAGVRDWLVKSRAGAQLLVLLDEGPYAARMAAQAGAADRLEERRRAWQAFVSERGLAAATVDLRPGEAADRLDAAAVDAVRSGLRNPAGSRS